MESDALDKSLKCTHTSKKNVDIKANTYVYQQNWFTKDITKNNGPAIFSRCAKVFARWSIILADVEV